MQEEVVAEELAAAGIDDLPEEGGAGGRGPGGEEEQAAAGIDATAEALAELEPEVGVGLGLEGGRAAWEDLALLGAFGLDVIAP